jgi:ATP-dependent RNA helicase RhlE
MNEINNFSDFSLLPELLEGIDSLGFGEPTPIQKAAIPIIMAGKDIIACAQTGTGKTAAYLIPLINKVLEKGNTVGIKALILSPTRELAMQIDQALEGLGYFANVGSVAIFGGNNKNEWDKQMAAIKNGVDVVVATPGRLLQHGSLGYLDFSQLEMLILDEADKMMDMGFHQDILRIVKELPATRQTLMFSATMPPKIREFSKNILRNPEEVNLKTSKPAEGIDQQVFICYENQKLGLLESIIKTQEVENMVIFSSSRAKADEIFLKLFQLGYAVNVIHSDRTQDERQSVLREFKNKEFKILVATDILSRGIDIEGLSHVLNFDAPHDPEDYVHRIGRTARANTKGCAITFVGERDQQKFQRVEAFLGRVIEKQPIPAHLGEGPEYGGRSKKPYTSNNSNSNNSNSNKPYNKKPAQKGNFQKGNFQRPEGENRDKKPFVQKENRNFTKPRIENKPENSENFPKVEREKRVFNLPKREDRPVNQDNAPKVERENRVFNRPVKERNPELKENLPKIEGNVVGGNQIQVDKEAQKKKSHYRKPNPNNKGQNNKPNGGISNDISPVK